MQSRKKSRESSAGGASGRELAEPLRAHQFRLTPQRAAVFRAVCELGHASPRQIHEVVRQTHPMLSLNTVYATLETLERVGRILRLTGPEGTLLYEAAFPIHHHLQCLTCRRVLDIQDPTLDEIPLPASIRGRFTVTRRRVEFYGYCPDCGRHLASATLKKEVARAPLRGRKARGKDRSMSRDRPTPSASRRALGAAGAREEGDARARSQGTQSTLVQRRVSHSKKGGRSWPR